jgi:hypothetical protein
MSWILSQAADDWRVAFILLTAYWALAASIVWLVHRYWCSKRRAGNPSRYRFWLALVIAIIFTPSLISDFWLFAFPGPAIFGLYLCVFAGFGQPAYWFAALLYYVLPMALVFAIAYAVLRFRDRRVYAPTA